MSYSRRNFIKGAMLTPLMVAAGKFAAAAPFRGAFRAEEWIVYIGTYTRTTSKGIYAWRFRPSSGKLISCGIAAESNDPTWLSLHPNGKFVYVTNELIDYGGERSGSVCAFASDPRNGALTLLNRVSTRGMNPSYSTVDGTGRWLIVDNYGGSVDGPGSVAVFRIQADGRLEQKPACLVPHAGSSIDPKQQRAAHPHATVLSPDNRFLLVPDKGADRVVQYRWDPNSGRLTPNDPPFRAAPVPGSGPRHLAFGVNPRFVYVNHELNSTVTTYSYDLSRGILSPLQTLSTLPKNFAGQSTTAEIEAHPGGKFLYVSNRGHDSIARFAIDRKEGTLKLLGHTPSGGSRPRKTRIDPTGQYMFAGNQNSDNIVIFKIDTETGELTPTGSVLEVPSPACILFVPAIG